MTASVVSNRPATEAAFWRAERTTFVRSITPARTKSAYSAAHSSSITEDTLRGGNPVCRRAQTRGRSWRPGCNLAAGSRSNATGRAGDRSGRQAACHFQQVSAKAFE
jgi:hypothetical protein